MAIRRMAADYGGSFSKSETNWFPKSVTNLGQSRWPLSSATHIREEGNEGKGGQRATNSMANVTRLQSMGPDELLGTYPDLYLSGHPPADRLSLTIPNPDGESGLSELGTRLRLALWSSFTGGSSRCQPLCDH
jgi:hypothetical protein